MKSNRFLLAGVTFTIALAVLAVLGIRSESPARQSAPIRASSGSNALELDVVDVNPVIARQFQLAGVTGVLLSDDPKGTVRRTSRLKRGDILLAYNGIEIQSATHLKQLMSHSRSGNTIDLTVVRRGREFNVSFHLPQTVEVGILQWAHWDIAAVLAILAITFCALFLDMLHRTVCVTLGAAAMVIAGTWLGFYDETKLFDAIQLSPILIYVGMSVFSILLERLRFLEYIAKVMIVRSTADVYRIVATLCGITYLFSLVVNNLSAILVMIPITISITRALRISPVPAAIAVIISSNIGGASTLVGDFPNMIIATSTGLTFQQFLLFMAPMCLVLLLSLYWFYSYFDCLPKSLGQSTVASAFSMNRMKTEVDEMRADMDWPAIYRVLWILGGVIVSFVLLPLVRIQTATVALAGGFLLLVFENKRASDILRRIGITDVLFFLSLFVIVGGAIHSGLLMSLSGWIDTLSMGSRIWHCMLLMWCACFTTAFLNAGPATVFFVPLVMNAPMTGMEDIGWWALSLGVLAGSCATLTGATAGIVTQTLLEEHSLETESVNAGEQLTFQKYSSTGVPVAFMFLVLSSLYIILLGLLV